MTGREPRDKERAQKWIALYRSGRTLQSIGTEFCVSRERVRQIVSFYGINRSRGGQHVVSVKNKNDRVAAQDARYLEKVGCSFAQYKTIVGKNAFRMQRRSAGYRGIEWKLTMWQWWNIWLESGKWEMRGRGRGRYCMARTNDFGPYEIGNVSIITTEQNASDAHKKIGRRQTRKRCDMTGIYKMYPGYARPYVVKHGNHGVGMATTYREALAIKRAHLRSLKAAA